MLSGFSFANGRLAEQLVPSQPPRWHALLYRFGDLQLRKPVRVTELVERLPPVLEDQGIRTSWVRALCVQVPTLVESNQ